MIFAECMETKGQWNHQGALTISTENVKTTSISYVIQNVYIWSDSTELNYRRFSNISRTQSQNINASHLVLQLYLPNPLKPGVKLRMKM